LAFGAIVLGVSKSSNELTTIPIALFVIYITMIVCIDMGISKYGNSSKPLIDHNKPQILSTELAEENLIEK